MKPLEVAARFAAFAWYTDCRQGRSTQQEARRFAKENWQAFRPVAHAGWGRLLLRIAKATPTSQRPPAAVNRPLSRKLAAAG
jgi:hypothetical protein